MGNGLGPKKKLTWFSIDGGKKFDVDGTNVGVETEGENLRGFKWKWKLTWVF